jgi:heme-degrading monooxygenase HmoA
MTRLVQDLAQVKNFASGNWVVRHGSEGDFVARWREFLVWTRENAPGLRGAVLMRDAEKERHYISTSQWDSMEAVLAWRSLPGFTEKLGACRALCEDFSSSNYTLAAAVDLVEVG